MLVNFRQGVVAPNTSFLLLNGSNNVDLVATSPVIVTIAQGAANYLHVEQFSITNAWVGPFSTSARYWLYWDFDLNTFARTFGYTTLRPIVSGITPTGGNDPDGIPNLTAGRMWFNTSNNINYQYSGAVWIPRLRVFAAFLNNGVFQTMGSSLALNDFTGTQIGNNTAVAAGQVLFDGSSQAVVRKNGTFLTTEDEIFSNGVSVTGIRLESNVSTAACGDASLAKFTVVSYNSGGQIVSANYIDIGTTVLGVVTQDLIFGQVGSVVLQGVVTNLNWNWLAQTHANGAPVQIGEPLWVDNGLLVVDDPHVIDAVAYPIGNVPVARILNTNTVIFEQGLGGKGEQGPPGTATNVSISAVTSTPGLTITGSPVPSNGTLTFGLTPELVGVATLATQGLITRTGVGTYVPRTIQSNSSKVSVTNGSGILGNPLIDVNEANLNLANIGGVLPITKGGTGQTTATAALNALLPVQAGNAGFVLATDGTNALWQAAGAGTGTVTSVDATGGAGISVTGGPITASGSLTITNTGVTSIAASAPVVASAATGAVNLSVNLFNDASSGIVPASGGGTTKYLRSDGTWQVPPAGTGTVTSVGAAISGVGLVLSGSPITTSGTLTFALGLELQSLSQLNTTGFVARTGASTYAPRSLTAGSAISITNPSGIAGNPTIALDAAAVTSLPNLSIGQSQVTGLVTAINSKQNNLEWQSNGGVPPGGPVPAGQITTINFASGMSASIAGSTLTVTAAGGGGGGGVTEVNVEPAPGTFGITASGNPIIANGTIYLTLDDELQALSQLATTGYIRRTGVATYSTQASPIPIVDGGTGEITANAAFNALAPSQVGNSGRFLTTDGSNTSWADLISSVVTSFNGQVGNVVLTSFDIATALGYTPVAPTVFTDVADGLVPASGGGSTKYLRSDGVWFTPAGSGTVTSVDLTPGLGISVSGGPITSAGSITVTNTGVLTVNGNSGDIVLTNADVGLGNVTNNAQVPLSTVTSKGDLIVGTALATVAALPVGLDGQVLIADSAEVTGVRWDNVVSGVSSFNSRTGAVLPDEGDYTLTLLGDVTITGPTGSQLLQYNGSEWVNWTPNFLTGNQSITLTGDVTGTGTTSITTTLSNSGVVAGTYNNIQVDARGIAINGSNLPYARTDEVNVWEKAQTAEPVVGVISAGVLTLDASESNVFYVAQGENITSFTVTNPLDGETILIQLDQTTNGNTVAWPADFQFVGNSEITALNGKMNIVAGLYNATTAKWYVAVQNEPSGTPSGVGYDYITGVSGTGVVTTTNVTCVAASSGRAYIQVFLNGILQREGGNFNVTGTSELTFTFNLVPSDEVIVYQL